jgi:hypothetical protein
MIIPWTCVSSLLAPNADAHGKAHTATKVATIATLLVFFITFSSPLSRTSLTTNRCVEQKDGQRSSSSQPQGGARKRLSRHLKEVTAGVLVLLFSD